MSSRFLKVKTVDGVSILVNVGYVTLISPTHGTDFSDGADLVIMTFGEQGVLELSVPASQTSKLIDAALKDSGQFMDVKSVDGSRTLVNREFVTHIVPKDGVDFSDGVSVCVLGAVVEVPASGTQAILNLLG